MFITSSLALHHSHSSIAFVISTARGIRRVKMPPMRPWVLRHVFTDSVGDCRWSLCVATCVLWVRELLVVRPSPAVTAREAVHAHSQRNHFDNNRAGKSGACAVPADRPRQSTIGRFDVYGRHRDLWNDGWATIFSDHLSTLDAHGHLLDLSTGPCISFVISITPRPLPDDVWLRPPPYPEHCRNAGRRSCGMIENRCAHCPSSLHASCR